MSILREILYYLTKINKKALAYYYLAFIIINTF